jgi:hypothetical protein
MASYGLGADVKGAYDDLRTEPVKITQRVGGHQGLRDRRDLVGAQAGLAP